MEVSQPDNYVNRLAMPMIRGGLNSSIADILEVSGYGTETDIKVDDEIGTIGYGDFCFSFLNLNQCS